MNNKSKDLDSFLTSMFHWFLEGHKDYLFLELFYFNCSFAATLVPPFFYNDTIQKSLGFCIHKKPKNFIKALIKLNFNWNWIFKTEDNTQTFSFREGKHFKH